MWRYRENHHKRGFLASKLTKQTNSRKRGILRRAPGSSASLGGQQIRQNGPTIADREGVVPLVLEEVGLTIRELCGHFLGQLPVEIAILFSVPETHGHPHLREGKSPRLSIDRPVAIEAIRPAAPGLEIVVKTGFKNRVVSQGLRFRRREHAQHPRPQPHRRTDPRQGARRPE